MDKKDKQREFISEVKGIFWYWLTQTKGTTEKKMDGLAFSLMNKLDEGYRVIPLAEKGVYSEEEEATFDKYDIGGYLHELYVKKEERP